MKTRDMDRVTRKEAVRLRTEYREKLFRDKDKYCLHWQYSGACEEPECPFAHGRSELMRLSDPNFRKEPCDEFLQRAWCRTGLHCTKYHSLEEKKLTNPEYKAKFCREFMNGAKCTTGKSRCFNAHSEEELRGLDFFRTTFCDKEQFSKVKGLCANGKTCEGAHGEKQLRYWVHPGEFMTVGSTTSTTTTTRKRIVTKSFYPNRPTATEIDQHQAPSGSRDPKYDFMMGYAMACSQFMLNAHMQPQSANQVPSHNFSPVPQSNFFGEPSTVHPAHYVNPTQPPTIHGEISGLPVPIQETIEPVEGKRERSLSPRTKFIQSTEKYSLKTPYVTSRDKERGRRKRSETPDRKRRKTDSKEKKPGEKEVERDGSRRKRSETSERKRRKTDSKDRQPRSKSPSRETTSWRRSPSPDHQLHSASNFDPNNSVRDFNNETETSSFGTPSSSSMEYLEASTIDNSSLNADSVEKYFSKFGSLVWCMQSMTKDSTVCFCFMTPSLNKSVLEFNHRIDQKSIHLIVKTGN